MKNHTNDAPSAPPDRDARRPELHGAAHSLAALFAILFVVGVATSNVPLADWSQAPEDWFRGMARLEGSYPSYGMPYGR